MNPSASSSENTRVQTYEVQSRKTIAIPANQPTFHLVKKPKTATVVSTSPTEIVVKGNSIGETLILVWEAGGVRSYRIRVIRTFQQQKIIEASRIESSRLLRSQRDRTFKFRYRSDYEIFNEADVLTRISETRKTYDHRVSVSGMTPIGDLRGALLYEYRKEIAMAKSVAIPRDFHLGFYETTLPFLKDYDVIGGAHYGTMGNYSMPGQRYNGLTIRPSRKRVENATQGQYDLHFFVGLKRDGSTIDNPPGTHNRELEGKVVGERLDYYLWDEGRISLGAVHQWKGQLSRLQSKHNFDSSFDFQFPYLRLRGEGGLDDENRVGGHVEAILEHSVGELTGRYFSVANEYGTITGSTLDRGTRGFETTAKLYPLVPFTGSEAIRLTGDVEWVRNHLSSNPARFNDFTIATRTKLDIRFPHKITSESLFIYRDNMASSFPFTEKEWKQRLSKEFNFNRFLLKRSRIFISNTIESYRDAENSPGFNTTRYELGAGISVHAKGGFWASSQYRWNRLKEEDLTTPPARTTKPDQLTVTGGWAHAFSAIPLRMSADIRWVEEGETHSKVHQPFLNEDRLEARGSMNWALYDYGSLFMQVRSTVIRPTVVGPNRAELSIMGGLRMLWDTHFYIPQRGRISGYVFDDQNANGIRDPGEKGIMGHEVVLEDGVRTETNADGFYEIRTREGIWRLIGTGEIPEGYFFTTINRHRIELMPKDDLTFNFGIAPQVQVKGNVFVDINENQLFEKGDIPMQGIQIVLNSGQAGISTAKGYYSILRVAPGPNQVRLVLDSLPPGYRTMTAIEKNFEAAPGDVLNFNVILKAQRLVRGHVYIDRNENGHFDTGEEGVPNAVIRHGDQVYQTGLKGQFFIADLQPGTNRVFLATDQLPPGLKAQLQRQEFEVGSGSFLKHSLDFPVVKTADEK